MADPVPNPNSCCHQCEDCPHPLDVPSLTVTFDSLGCSVECTTGGGMGGTWSGIGCSLCGTGIRIGINLLCNGGNWALDFEPTDSPCSGTVTTVTGIQCDPLKIRFHMETPSGCCVPSSDGTIEPT